MINKPELLKVNVKVFGKMAQYVLNF